MRPAPHSFLCLQTGIPPTVGLFIRKPILSRRLRSSITWHSMGSRLSLTWPRMTPRGQKIHFQGSRFASKPATLLVLKRRSKVAHKKALTHISGISFAQRHIHDTLHESPRGDHGSSFGLPDSLASMKRCWTRREAEILASSKSVQSPFISQKRPVYRSAISSSSSDPASRSLVCRAIPITYPLAPFDRQMR